MYVLKMEFFDNGKPEEFLLIIHNLKMILEESRNLTENSNIQYLHTLFHRNKLRQFDPLYVQVGSTTMEISTQSFWVWVLIFPF